MQEIAKNDARSRSCASWAELERSGHVERVTVVLKRNGKGSYGIDLNDYNVVTASTHTRPMTLTTIKSCRRMSSRRHWRRRSLGCDCRRRRTGRRVCLWRSICCKWARLWTGQGSA